MKNSIKSLFILSLLFLVLSGCSNQTSENVCLLSICIDDANHSRTINPVSLTDNISYLSKFVLKGDSRTTGAKLNGGEGIDLTSVFEGNPPVAVYEIPFGSWDLTLEAGDGTEVWLEGRKTVEINKYEEEIVFDLKTDSILKNGSVSLLGTFVDEGSVAQTYKAGLYSLSDGALKYPQDLIEESVASNSFSFNQLNVKPGRYSFQVKFYNSDVNKPVGYWEDIVVIAPGRQTEKTDIECNAIICQKPNKPAKLKAYSVNDTYVNNEQGEFFTARFAWEDKSTNEQSFVLEINECKGKSDKELKEGGLSFVYSGEDGCDGLKAGSTQCEIQLPCNKYFIASIKARNFVGDSEACDYDNSNVSNAPSGTKKISGQTIWYEP